MACSRKADALAVPNIREIKEAILHEYHDNPFAGHVGVTKTLRSLARSYWWPKMRQEVEDYIRRCGACQRNKAVTTKPAGLLQPLPIPEERFDTITMDFITHLPETADKHTSIVVFVDKLTKYTMIAPCKDTTSAVEVAELLMEHVHKYFGMPNKIVCDRDSRFTSSFLTELYRLTNTKVLMSSAFHPQTDGQTERANRVLEEMLRHYINPKQDNWDKLLGPAQFAINNAWQESIQNTPHFLVTLRQHRTPGLTKEHQSRVPAATNFVQMLQDNLKRAKQCLVAAQDRDRLYANKKRRHVEFEVGTQVLLNTRHVPLKHPGTRKLLMRWMGPFTITERVGCGCLSVGAAGELPHS